MRDTLSEAEGCELLTRVFRARGYAIRRNVTFREYGVVFKIDGWDAKARVGFEFLSSEADDHHELSLGEFKRLMAAQQRGELALFVVDEVEELSAAGLEEAATQFLDEFAAAAARRKPRRPAARKAPARKKASKRPAVKPAARSRPAGRKRR